MTWDSAAPTTLALSESCACTRARRPLLSLAHSLMPGPMSLSLLSTTKVNLRQFEQIGHSSTREFSAQFEQRRFGKHFSSQVAIHEQGRGEFQLDFRNTGTSALAGLVGEKSARIGVDISCSVPPVTQRSPGPSSTSVTLPTQSTRSSVVAPTATPVRCQMPPRDLRIADEERNCVTLNWTPPNCLKKPEFYKVLFIPFSMSNKFLFHSFERFISPGELL